MTTFIALLRGINVAGHNKIKMIDLKQLFVDLDFKDVITYIQSGNILFKSTIKDTNQIENSIIKAIFDRFGFTIKVLVLTKEELTAIFESNPFLNKNSTDITKLHVTLLNKAPQKKEVTDIETIILNSNDSFQIVEKCVYLYCSNGYGKTKLSNTFLENKLKSSATTRNWKTITKLVELST